MKFICFLLISNIILVLIFFVLFYNSFKIDLIKIKSINNKYYYTQRIKSLEASKILILLEKFTKKLSYYIIKEYPDNLYIKNKLKNKIIIKEMPSNYNNYISYIQNKNIIYI